MAIQAVVFRMHQPRVVIASAHADLLKPNVCLGLLPGSHAAVLLDFCMVLQERKRVLHRVNSI